MRFVVAAVFGLAACVAAPAQTIPYLLAPMVPFSTGPGAPLPPLPAFQAAISTLANGSAGDAFGSNPTFIPAISADYETTVSVLVADELFGGL